MSWMVRYKCKLLCTVTNRTANIPGTLNLVGSCCRPPSKVSRELLIQERIRLRIPQHSHKHEKTRDKKPQHNLVLELYLVYDSRQNDVLKILPLCMTSVIKCYAVNYQPVQIMNSVFGLL